MKRVLLIIAYIMTIHACDILNIGNNNNLDNEKISIFTNLDNENWDLLAIKRNGSFLISDTDNGIFKHVVGSINNDTTFVRFNDTGMPESIISNLYSIQFEYEDDHVIYILTH